jgi:sodium/bile acid cotransporter 7
LGKKGGYIRSEYSVKYGGISLIFFFSGLSLKTKDLARSVLFVKLHTLVQLFSLGLIPLSTWLLSLVILRIDSGFDRNITEGLIILGCVPTTVSSSVVLVKSANGNEPAALFNATIGNLIGKFL